MSAPDMGAAVGLAVGVAMSGTGVGADSLRANYPSEMAHVKEGEMTTYGVPTGLYSGRFPSHGESGMDTFSA